MVSQRCGSVVQPIVLQDLAGRANFHCESVRGDVNLPRDFRNQDVDILGRPGNNAQQTERSASNDDGIEPEPSVSKKPVEPIEGLYRFMVSVYLIPWLIARPISQEKKVPDCRIKSAGAKHLLPANPCVCAPAIRFEPWGIENLVRIQGRSVRPRISRRTIGSMTTEFLDRLAEQLRSRKSAACRRAIGRILTGVKKQCEEGVYASKPEAERAFRALVEKEPACRECNPEMKRER